MILFPDKKYKTILVDPPWKYGRSWDTGSIKSAFGKRYNVNSYPMPYKEMTTGEIASLDLPSLFDENCDVYLWATQKYLLYWAYKIQAWYPMGMYGIFCFTASYGLLNCHKEEK